MHITVIAVGKLKERHYAQACAEYLKRLGPYAKVDIVEVPDRDVTRDETRALAEEGRAILKSIPGQAHVVVLDPAATQCTSEQFSGKLDELALQGSSALTFVVGGAAGLSGEVRARADESLSLGLMTYPHQLARVMLLEQLYRAFRISRKEPYHR